MANKKIGSRYYKDIGIDLGTANIVIFLRGKGIIMEEPSVVAIHARTGEILSIGNEAKEMIGRTPADIIALRPLRNGVIADFNITRQMLSYYINKALKKHGVMKPRVLIGVPMGITEVERRAVIEAASHAGAKEVFLIEEPIAAAIGAGLPVEEPRGNLIVDIGGGTTEVALISLGGIVEGKSIRIGGDTLNMAILRFIRRKYNVDIGERTAERIKIENAYAIACPQEETANVKGRNLENGLPVSLDIPAAEISEAIAEPLNAILEAVRSTLEKTPPELAADVMTYGMTLAGGGALLKKIDRFLSHGTNMPVYVADNPLSCVALGTGYALENIQFLRKSALK